MSTFTPYPSINYTPGCYFVWFAYFLFSLHTSTFFPLDRRIGSTSLEARCWKMHKHFSTVGRTYYVIIKKINKKSLTTMENQIFFGLRELQYIHVFMYITYFKGRQAHRPLYLSTFPNVVELDCGQHDLPRIA